MKTLKSLGLGLLLCLGLHAQETKIFWYPESEVWKSSFSAHWGTYDDYSFTAFNSLKSQYFSRSGAVNYTLLMRNAGLTSRFITQGDPVVDFGLEESYTSWGISNSLTSSYRPMIYSIGYQYHLKPWISVSTQLSYLDFGLNFQSQFFGAEDMGTEPNSLETLDSYYQYRFKAVANTYQIRLNSPYLWQRIGFFVQAGLGFQFNFDSSLEEQNEYQRYDYSTGTNTKGFNQYRFEAKTKNSFDPLVSPWEVGLSLCVLKNVRLEGFYRMQNNFGASEMAPTNNTIVGFNLVVNAAVLR